MDLVREILFDLSSGQMLFFTDSRIDLIHCILRFVSDFSFVIWDLTKFILSMNVRIDHPELCKLHLGRNNRDFSMTLIRG